MCMHDDDFEKPSEAELREEEDEDKKQYRRFWSWKKVLWAFLKGLAELLQLLLLFYKMTTICICATIP